MVCLCLPTCPWVCTPAAGGILSVLVLQSSHDHTSDAQPGVLCCVKYRDIVKNAVNGLFVHLKCFSSIINHSKHSTIHVYSPIHTLTDGTFYQGALIIYTHIHMLMHSIHGNLGFSVLPKDTSTGRLEEPRIELPISANSAFGPLQKLPGQMSLSY